MDVFNPFNFYYWHVFLANATFVSYGVCFTFQGQYYMLIIIIDELVWKSISLKVIVCNNYCCLFDDLSIANVCSVQIVIDIR